MTIDAGLVPTLDWVRQHKADILRLARANHASDNVRVFGSVARGDADSNSDIDFLVEFTAGASLFDIVALEMDLAELLGMPVDVMSVKARGYASDHARAQAVTL